jgi:hypothetical protein
MHMPKQDDIEAQAAKAADRFEALDVDALEWRDATELREVAVADEGIRLAKQRLRDAVEAARAKGVSWTAIGGMLGISRQAARERFTRPSTSSG